MFIVLGGLDYEGLINPGKPLPVFTSKEDARAYMQSRRKRHPVLPNKDRWYYLGLTYDLYEVIELDLRMN